MDKNMKLIIISLLLFGFISGCSTFNRTFPDRTTDYQQSESLPDLEIPPDLTADAINSSMAVPGERSRVQARPQPADNTQILAAIESTNDDIPLLSIPLGYNQAWVEVEQILQNAEIIIDESDKTTGLFKINYWPDAPQSDEGFLSSLAFWKRGGSKPYQLYLTGSGDKTELMVVDEGGVRINTEDTDLLLSTIRDHYNLSRTQ